jgi:hypothetical protein
MATSRLPIATLTQRELESKWQDLLGATLEAWAHMILYVRRVYPADSFGPSPTTAPFGLRLHVNRHPAVAAYIADAIRVALPSLTTSPRVADAITLTILDTNPPLPEEERPRYDVLSQSHLALMDVDDDDDEDENRLGQTSPPDQDHHYQPQDQEKADEIVQPEPLVLEKYELRFPQDGGPGAAGGRHGRHDEGRHDDKGMMHSGSNATSHTNNDKTLYSLSAIDYLEREMRAILLSVYAMQEDHVTDDDDDDDDDDDKMSSESLSFTISLHILQANATCDVLDRAMATGEWRSPPNGGVVPHHLPHRDVKTPSHQQDHRRTTTTTDQKMPYVLRPLHTMDATTSPVGPVQFVVKYPRPVGRRRRRPAAASAALRKQADSGDGGGWKRHKRDTSSRGDNNHNLTQDSTGTQSTPTLDF